MAKMIMKNIHMAFMHHYGVSSIDDIKLQDGDYIVPIDDQEFGVRVEGCVVSRFAELNKSKMYVAMRMGPPIFVPENAKRIGENKRG